MQNTDSGDFMKRILSLFLALLCVLPLFAACQNGTRVTVVKDGACTVIYDSALVSDEEANLLSEAITAATGATVTLKSSISFTAGIISKPGDIIVGNLETVGTKDVLARLRLHDFCVTTAGEEFLIGAKTADTAARAIAYFKEQLGEIAKFGKDLTLDGDDYHLDHASYAVETLKIGDAEVCDYRIVTSAKATVSEQRFARALQQLLLDKTGYLLPIMTLDEQPPARQIRIGSICESAKPQGDHGFATAGGGTVLELTAASYYAYDKLLSSFANTYLNAKEINLWETSALSGNAVVAAGDAYTHHGDIRLMFNNIWGSTSGVYSQRVKMLVELYAAYRPDVLGLQECSPDMRDVGVIDRLYALGYKEVPIDRNFVPYKKETETRDPLLYREEVLELVDYGYQNLAVITELNEIKTGLNATQLGSAEAAIKEAKADGSKSVNWAIFKVKATGELFMAASVHLWWKSGTYHDKIRVVQMREMRELLTGEAAEYLDQNGLSGTMPIFIGGDYNSRTTRASYATMSEGPTPFTNLNVLVEESKQIDCTSSHSYPTYDKKSGFWQTSVAIGYGSYDQAIDHIYANAAAVTAGSFTVEHIAIVKDLYAYLSSDHNAIYTDVSFTATTPRLPS